MADTGELQVQALISDSYDPIENATVTVTPNVDNPGATREITKSLPTDSSGQTKVINLNTPPIEYSQRPSPNLPYSLYDLKVEATGYEPFIVKGCQIYPNQQAIQQCPMKKASTSRQGEVIINILPNTLVGNFPPKIPEDPDKPEPPTTGGVVLNQPVIPEFIIVHDGVPNDANAPNYYVPYKDYIKNVAACEIFSTWPSTTIEANILCIISFTLNRVFTEWYRGKGKNFTITSSTAYDHAFVYRRNIYANISRTVDEIFSTYVKRPGRKQPLLTQYCDGVRVKCPGWLTQWGSKYRGDIGQSSPQILKYFYGSDLVFDTAKKVEGVPSSYPGYNLGIGSKGGPVRTIQAYLNRISDNYPAIPKVAVDGLYGMNTRKAVIAFQKAFYLPATGVVNYATWYKISDIYTAVTKIAELRGSSGNEIFVPPDPFAFDLNEVPAILYPKDV